ncbi:MAG: ATP-dependent helicase [Microbacteriaceae bacterium]|nr:ATP-dependent helicase [Microbacteriaceae bacterium]
MTTVSAPSAVSALQIAEAIAGDPPTPQQQAVIEADLAPALVIAGAGSGKTETMANRVLYLLANGLVKPSEVLGLTFTRKAAGELARRIRDRIEQLAAAGLIGSDYDVFDAPTVATYNSFANSIYRDNAALIGRESDAAVLSEASSWQLARSIVVASHDVRLADLDKSVDVVTKAVIALNHELSEIERNSDDVRRMVAELGSVLDLPYGGRSNARYPDVRRSIEAVHGLPVLLDLADAFAAAKASRGLVEYSDQVALALTATERVPRIAEELRERYSVVLLDEYQDTSVVQTRLLKTLFRDHAVMAVGDPHQSIYGWRGASAANLGGFPADFSGSPAAVAKFDLSTSWRNGHGILAAANTIVEKLNAVTKVEVGALTASPAASDERLSVVFEETVAEEAAATAAWLKAQLAVRSRKGEQRSAAMLLRTRSTLSVFTSALDDAGVPYHVLGIGGLLQEPEIVDLVSALWVVNDPTAGSQLIRLLTGSRWRIGVQDIQALSRLASWLRDRDYAHQPLADELREAMRASVAESEGGSIVEALDFLAHARPGHGALAGFSEAGLSRMREAGALFARLRSRANLELVDFVTLVEQELMLDIEVSANDRLPLGNGNLEAFFDALGGYLASDDNSSLGGFLGWLTVAEWRDSLGPRPEDPEPGTVQLLTIHGSKGLEWDIVAVPRLVEGELPGASKDGYNGWLSLGALPYEFRGDAAELPVLRWRGIDSQKEFDDNRKQFKLDLEVRHRFEERRLAYVAVTRAKHSLLLSGSFWSKQSKPRTPSEFLLDLEAAGVVGELPTASEHEENPLGSEPEYIQWPVDPLGVRRRRVEAGAAAVRAAAASVAPDAGASVVQAGVEPPGKWSTDLTLLLRERERRMSTNGLVAMPVRVAASRFKDFVTDPAGVASALRRPMPERPYKATQIGTLFHSWVESRYGMGGTSEALDSLLTEIDDGDATGDITNDADFARLQDTFSRSVWADRRPVDVEREIHLPFDDRIVICKIDAVYFDGGRYEVVDWKTGKAPKDAADLERKQLQLALYRLAYSRWAGIDPALIDAVFYFVADDRVVTPERIFDEDELVALWRKAFPAAS